MNWIDKALVALAFGVALGMLGAACPTPDPGPTPDPPDPQQAPCERACHTLHDLGCPGGADYAKCRVTCEDTEDSGVARFCPENVAAIKSCSELDVAFEACE